MKRLQDEQGGTSILMVCAGVLIAACVAVIVELGSAFVQLQMLDTRNAIAKDALATASFELNVKNADNPQLTVAQGLASALRKDGYDGDIEVAVYEVTPQAAGTARRIIIWSCKTAAEHETAIGSTFGFGAIPLASTITGSIVMRSDGAVWRPGDQGAADSDDQAFRANGIYRLEAGEPPEALAGSSHYSAHGNGWTSVETDLNATSGLIGAMAAEGFGDKACTEFTAAVERRLGEGA